MPREGGDGEAKVGRIFKDRQEFTRTGASGFEKSVRSKLVMPSKLAL